MSSLFGSLDTTKLDKVDVVDPNAEAEAGKAADAKSTYEELTRIFGMASDAKELAESKADKATTLAGYGITDAATKIDLASKADLADGKVPAAQLPSFVDDVLEYDAMSSFPATGEDGKIYIDKETNKTYRWSGTQYVEISQSLALGETESTAYPGNKGKIASETASTAYDVAKNAAITIVSHTENKSNPHAVTTEQIGAVPLVEDKERNKTAVTIGRRDSNEPVGKHSLVTGDIAAASGNDSHAEGFGTIASGDYSHAEGVSTTASGPDSHAEGVSTTASGNGSHAEGAGTVAYGQCSHAEGAGTVAYGQYSHASGTKAQTREDDSYAYAWNGDNTIPDPYTSNGPGTFNVNPVGGLNGFWIGEQTLDQVITAAISVKADYATTLAGYGITDAVPLVEDASGKKTAVTIGYRSPDVGPDSLANGDSVEASGNYSHAEGSATTASGNYSHAEGGGTTAAGDYSHAEGGGTTAAGDYSHAEGNDTTASGYSSHADGCYAHTKEQDSYAFAWNGDKTITDETIPEETQYYTSHGPGTFNVNPVGGLNGFWIGEQTLDQVITAAISVKADYATTLAGYGITDAVPFVEDKSGEKTAVTIGDRSPDVDVGPDSLANGDGVVASGNYSHAEGAGTTAAGDYSHAEGINTTASGYSSHAEGSATTAAGDFSHAEGAGTTAAGDFSHAEGAGTTAAGDYSHAEGIDTIASGQCSHASGTKAQTREGDSYAYAWNGDNTIPAPYTSNGPGTFNINPVGGPNGFWIGEQTLDQVITAAISVKADYATTLAGYGITDAVPFVEDKSGEKTAVTIGLRKSSEPVGPNSLANGNVTTASGSYSHAEGNVTTASGSYSHAEGSGTNASGSYSHAEGSGTNASGSYSHAEGDSTTASGFSSHAEGSATTAAGDYSHAEGDSTTASGYSSHAEGVGTTAAGDYSHADGYYAHTKEQDSYAYAWNGDGAIEYSSHDKGTFNINPAGGLDGFFIGEQTLAQVINAAITGKADLASIAPEYSATSAYFVGAIVYYRGNIYQCKTAIADGGEAWNAEHWELRKLDNFFTESNSLLTGTIDAEVISKGTAPDAHLEAPTDERLKLILADNSVAYDSAKALPYKLTSVIGDRVIATMTLTAASTDITLPTIAANDTTVKDFILDVTNAYAVEGVAADAGINIPRTDFKLVTRDGESLTAVTTVKAGKSAFICFTQKSPVVVDGTTYPCWCVIQLPFGDPS